MKTLNKEFSERISKYKITSRVIWKLLKYESKSMVDLKPYKNGKHFSYRKKTLRGISKKRTKIKTMKLLNKVCKMSKQTKDKAIQTIRWEYNSSEFRVVVNNRFGHAYKMIKSCMSRTWCRRYLGFYISNPNTKIAMVYLGKKPIWRSIIREDKYYDRVYWRWWQMKNNIRKILEREWYSSVRDNKVTVDMKLNESDTLPYLDNVRYRNSTLTKVSNRFCDEYFYIHTQAHNEWYNVKCHNCKRNATLLQAIIEKWRIKWCWRCMRDKKVKTPIIKILSWK